ncbi:hypothetical protein [Pseudaminobacter soli (ex Zhang et al. 2022)]|nr:hypothetical protein [Pseudaminobacter soli]
MHIDVLTLLEAAVVVISLSAIGVCGAVALREQMRRVNIKWT